MKRRFTTLKNASRTIVDYCVMPGTSLGAEIVWLYSLQWKNRVTVLSLGLISLIYSTMLVMEGRLNDSASTERENTL